MDVKDKTDAKEPKKRGRPPKHPKGKTGKKKYNPNPRTGVPTKNPYEHDTPVTANHMGRPTKYYDGIIDDLRQYFSIDQNNLPDLLPTIEGFAIKVGISKETIYQWAKIHPDFSDALKNAREIQQFVWANNTLQGKYNSSFAKFYGMNVFGWRERTDSDVRVNGIEDVLAAAYDKE